MGPESDRLVLAVDPGSDKCGLALVDCQGRCLRKAIVPSKDLTARVSEWVQEVAPEAIVLGDKTGSASAKVTIETLALGCPVVQVDEHLSTQEAREVYFDEQPPRGLKRLIPRGLLSPGHPLDDYAAWVLGKRYFDSAMQTTVEEEQ